MPPLYLILYKNLEWGREKLRFGKLQWGSYGAGGGSRGEEGKVGKGEVMEGKSRWGRGKS